LVVHRKFPHVYMGFPTNHCGQKYMSITVLDDRGRVVLPKEVLEELGASKGDAVVFEKRGKDLVIMKASSKGGRLEEIMDWNPKRTGKMEKVSPKTMKGIWKA